MEITVKATNIDKQKLSKFVKEVAKDDGKDDEKHLLRNFKADLASRVTHVAGWYLEPNKERCPDPIMRIVHKFRIEDCLLKELKKIGVGFSVNKDQFINMKNDEGLLKVTANLNIKSICMEKLYQKALKKVLDEPLSKNQKLSFLKDALERDPDLYIGLVQQLWDGIQGPEEKQTLIAGAVTSFQEEIMNAIEQLGVSLDKDSGISIMFGEQDFCENDAPAPETDDQ